MKVGVIGAGTMGSGIAQAFAQCDKVDTVYLCDIKQEFADGGKAKVQKSMDKLVSKGKKTQEEADAIMAKFKTGLNEICTDADLIVEAALEVMDIKKECFKNAATLVDLAHFYKMGADVRYVEGLALDPALPISIEHAWVRVGGKYIDPTAERCLKADVTKWEYVALIEKDWKGMVEVLTETEYYGDVYRYEFIKSLGK